MKFLAGGSAAALAVALAGAGVSAQTEEAPRAGFSGSEKLGVSVLNDSLSQPWGLDFLPDGRMLVTEKTGEVKLLSSSGAVLQTVANPPESVVHGQGGLLDVLVHPDFAQEQWVYFSAAVGDEQDGYTTQVSRARLRNGALQDHEILFTAQPRLPNQHHFGSRLYVDPAGYLFITVGDRGERDLAQSLETHNGKVMRLHDDGRVPADNPFVNRAGAMPEIWSYGHRNPQGMAVHPDGSLWAAEHGPKGGDEVNRIEPGRNYGWPVITYGEEYRGGSIGEGTVKEGMQQPVTYYKPSIATAGITFYAGDRYPGWQPSLLVAGLQTPRLHRMELTAGGLQHVGTTLLDDRELRVRAVRQGPDGYIYLVADSGELIQLLPAN